MNHKIFTSAASRAVALSISGSMSLSAHPAGCKTPLGHTATNQCSHPSASNVFSVIGHTVVIALVAAVMAKVILADAANFVSPASAAEHGQWLCFSIADQFGKLTTT
jgi:hypothetical protein